MSEERDRVAALVGLVVDGLGLDATVTVTEGEDALVATVEGDDLGRFIGRHGQMIDAVQHLAHCLVVRDRHRPARRLVVDAAGYRARRQAALEGMADDAADTAVANDAPYPLEPMNAAERRIVHEHLRDRTDVETYSEGDEPERHLVVAPREG